MVLDLHHGKTTVVAVSVFVGVSALAFAATLHGCNGKTSPVGAEGSDSGAPDTGAPSPRADASLPDTSLPDASLGDAALTDTSAMPDADSGPEWPSCDAGLLMIRQSVLPPRYAAGLDLGGGNGLMGLTLAAAEQAKCGCAPLPNAVGGYEDAGAAVQSCSWGNQDVVFTYFTSNQRVWMLEINSGYPGAVGCSGTSGLPPGVVCVPLQSSPASKFGPHTYVIPINSQIQRDGEPFPLEWGNLDDGATGDASTSIAELDELASALITSYAPGAPLEDECIEDGKCVVGRTGYTPYFGVLPVGLYITFESFSAGAQVADTPFQFQLYEGCNPAPGDAGIVCQW